MKYNFELDLDTRNSLSIIVNRIKPGSTVLEFGPANGRMTKYLKEKLDCKIYAVELDQSAARDAAPFCEKILVEDVENYNWLEEYKLLSFDYIVFADILEHLYYPEKVLKQAKSLLSDNGSILISIPNVSHNAIIMDLLNDKFTYRDVGLLDSTHIRFFTKQTLDELVSQCGLEIQYETGSYANPKHTEFGYSYSRLDDNLAEVLSNRKYGEVYQFILEAKKNAENPVFEFKQEELAVLYIDTGLGFNEAEKELTFFIYEENKNISFKLDQSYENVKSIRIDLFKNASELELNNIYINNAKFKGTIQHNGCKNSNNILYLHDEPQITISFENTITLKDITFDIKCFKKIFNIKERKLIEERKLINRLKNMSVDKVKRKLMMLLEKNKRAYYLTRKIYAYIRMNGFIFSLKQRYYNYFYKTKTITFVPSEVIKNNISNFKDKMSIVIPTYNGLQDLTKLIPQLLNQQGFDNIEIVIIDSSSQDGTQKFFEHFSEIKFVTIDQKDFSHSYARNLGFEHTDGKYILFMVQDALPTSELWLYQLTKILISNKLVALSCSQVVNSEADLYTCYGLDVFNDFLGLQEPVTNITKKYSGELAHARKLCQLDNVACLFEADTFGRYQFRGKYAEDLGMGLRLIKDNNKIGMTSEVQIIHSHLRAPSYYLKRAIVETEVVNAMFEKTNTKDVMLEDEIADILMTFLLMGLLLVEIKKISTPISSNDFSVQIINCLERLMKNNFEELKFSMANNVISEYDEYLSQILMKFYNMEIKPKKGSLFYSIHAVTNEGLKYLQEKRTSIDQKTLSEFCLFILKMTATSSGVKLANNKEQYKQQYPSMIKMFDELQSGI